METYERIRVLRGPEQLLDGDSRMNIWSWFRASLTRPDCDRLAYDTSSGALHESVNVGG